MLKRAALQQSMVVGVSWGCAAAVAFGGTLPLLAWVGAGVGPFVTAALLYAGASLAALAQKAFIRDAGAPLTRREVAPLVVMAVAGAAVAPSLLAWGLQRTDAVTSGLLLNAEVAWTVVLARLVYRESLGRRGALAVVVMVAGGLVLALKGSGAGGTNWAGVAAVVGAMFAWAVDNVASRRLAELPPLTVVALKGGLGALLTGVVVLGVGERLPEWWRVGALLATGATGYGLSLRFYLLAQRRLGAARTASVYSLAPFVGAALGLIITPSAFGWPLAVAAALFVVGVVLHAIERHEHPHSHLPLEHEHPHRHDDGHHFHRHDEVVLGEHSHLHRHELLHHAHDHGPDVHHTHEH